MAKAKTAAEKRHHDRIAQLPCAVCGVEPVQVHHVISDGYKRLTKNHAAVIPLCFQHHTAGPNAVHRIGTANFNMLYGIDQLAEARRLWENG